MSSKPRPQRWLQFGIGTLLFATFCVAGFLAGYRRGLHAGQEAKPLAGVHAKSYDVRDIIESTPHGNAFGRTLTRYIQESILPGSWQNQGGPGALAYYDNNKTIVISNQPDAQIQVADTLKQIRRLQRQGKSKELEAIFASVGN